MESLFEILKTILPAIIAGLSTFLITKYTYNKNIPIDKLEISYNRIYYPLYELINNKNDTNYEEYKIYLDSIISEAEFRIKKYRKYIDRATLKAFNLMLYSNTQAKKEENFYIFKDNIYDRCAYLRRRLGYLEPNYIQLYKYSSNSDRRLIRLSIELCLILIFAMIGTIFPDNLQMIFVYIIAILMLFIFIEILFAFINILWNKISEIINLIKSHK